MTRRLLALSGVVMAAGWLAAASAPSAQALPGQCISSPFGGFCDDQAEADGSFRHCENSGFAGFGYWRCFQACHDPVSNLAVPTDLDLKTPC